MAKISLHALAILLFSEMCAGALAEWPGASEPWNTCRSRGRIYADCGCNVSRLIQGWIELKRDAKTHLYSRGKTWDYHNEAADHYSSLVLMAFYVAPEHNEPGGTFHEAMVSSRKLCATPSGIPTLYHLKTGKHAISGDEKYRLAAEQIADPLLLDPEHAITRVRYGDHGCELTPGLTELFVVESKLHQAKAEEYRKPLQRLLDRILADASHPETGLFCAKAGGHGKWSQPPDTWGYVLFGHENYDRACGSDRYRSAIERPLRWLLDNRADFDKHRETLWPRASSSDDWSDSYESMVVLWNRSPRVGDGFQWLDWATLQHIHRRKPTGEYGPYTGGHFDGSTGRTLCIHMMLCSQGVRHVPFQLGVGVGAVQQGDELLLTVQSDSPYRGVLRFDGPRTEYRNLTIDWCRINEMPQWYVVRPKEQYSLTVDEQPPRTIQGRELIAGMPIDVARGGAVRIRVRQMRDEHPTAVGDS